MKQPTIIQPEGTRPTDEVFSHEIMGSINASAVKRAIDAGELKFQKGEAAFNESTYNMLKSADINPKRVAALTEAQTEEPVILARDWAAGYDYQIDGLHRLARRVKDGKSTFKFYLLNLADLDAYRVKFGHFDTETGKFEEVDHKKIAESGWGEYCQHNEDGSRKTEEEMFEYIRTRKKP